VDFTDLTGVTNISLQTLFSQCNVTEWRHYHADERAVTLTFLSPDSHELRYSCCSDAPLERVLVFIHGRNAAYRFLGRNLTATANRGFSLVGRDLVRVGNCSYLVDYIVTYVTCPYTCCLVSGSRSDWRKPHLATIWWTRLSIRKPFSNFLTPNYWSHTSDRTPPYYWLTIRHWTMAVSRGISWWESNSRHSHSRPDQNPCL